MIIVHKNVSDVVINIWAYIVVTENTVEGWRDCKTLNASDDLVSLAACVLSVT